MEMTGSNPSVVHGSVHGPVAGKAPYAFTADASGTTPLHAGFHVYGLLWLPGAI